MFQLCVMEAVARVVHVWHPMSVCALQDGLEETVREVSM